jgi:pimeloyl-ACP methyl ester carboxylesterase
MKQIYCISGLAADHTLFANLSISGYNLVPVPWVAHAPNDDMATYAAKMYHSMNCRKPIILGLSLGGMLATEIAKTFPVERAILVSSAKTKQELGYNSMLLRGVYSSNIIPDRIMSSPDRLKLFMLGAHRPEEKRVLAAVMHRADPAFTKWAIGALLHWQNTDIPPNITHLHGTADRVIRPFAVHPDYWIQNGSHIMILNRATEISDIIGRELTRNV